jgi:hypothetical protein
VAAYSSFVLDKSSGGIIYSGQLNSTAYSVIFDRIALAGSANNTVTFEVTLHACGTVVLTYPSIQQDTGATLSAIQGGKEALSTTIFYGDHANTQLDSQIYFLTPDFDVGSWGAPACW